MTILTHTLKSDNYDQILIEIRYFIATARAAEREIASIKIDLDAEASVRAQSAVLKTLRTMKKEGKIDFFANGDDFSKASAEASYLMNKFSGLIENLDMDKSIFIVKV